MTDSGEYPPQFLSDLEAIYGQLTARSDARSIDLDWLADRFRDWRQDRQERLKGLLNKLDQDDPLRCPVSLFGTMDYGRLETAHTRTLAWPLHPRAEHGFDDYMLRAVLRWVDGPDDLEVEQVTNEQSIGQGEDAGRLDVLVWGADRTSTPCWTFDRLSAVALSRMGGNLVF